MINANETIKDEIKPKPLKIKTISKHKKFRPVFITFLIKKSSNCWNNEIKLWFKPIVIFRQIIRVRRFRDTVWCHISAITCQFNIWQVDIIISQVDIIIWKVDIIHISHGFEGDIPEYQPRGNTKALARYVTRCRRQRVT